MSHYIGNDIYCFISLQKGLFLNYLIHILIYDNWQSKIISHYTVLWIIVLFTIMVVKVHSHKKKKESTYYSSDLSEGKKTHLYNIPTTHEFTFYYNEHVEFFSFIRSLFIRLYRQV